MNTITLDFSKCKYIDEIHSEFKIKFEFPDYYGKNLDALRDCLAYYTHDELTVEIAGFKVVEKLFEEYSMKIREVLKDVSCSCPNIKFVFIS